MRLRPLALPLLLSLSGAAAAAAGDDAEALLKTMADATRTLNYDGVFVYQSDARLDAMRLVHKFAAGTESERLVSLSGPAREVIRDGTRVTCLFADDQAAMVESNPPRDIVGLGFSAPVERLAQTYRFAIEGPDRVAGRAASIVSVKPESDDRYSYRLWIDDASRLLLKSVILGPGARALEQVQFTQIAVLDDVPDALLKPEISGSGFDWQTTEQAAATAATASPAAATPSWHIGWLPPGFALTETRVQNMAMSRMPVHHMVYSDGLAMVSVFIEELMADDEPVQGYSSRGAVNAFSRVVDAFQVTVVGEVPQATVHRIAASVAKPPQP